MARRSVLLILVAVAVAACVPDLPGAATPIAGSASVVPNVETASVPSSSTQTPTPTPVPSFVRPTPLPSPSFQVYEVRAGDTLTSIARLFGTTARSIAFWNRERYPSLDPDSPTYEPGLIKVGWMLLVIPTTVVDEDELPVLTPEPTVTPGPTPSD